MGDINTNLFQRQETHGNVNNTVAQQELNIEQVVYKTGAEHRTGCVQNKNSVHTMNCREWTNEEKEE